jgi:hypothetical protein
LCVTQEANAFQPASTKAGKPRVRMRWSNDVNLFIMRTYYQITKLETDLTTYRKLLHERFMTQYPGVNVSEQRVSDQRRTIIRNKMIPDEELAQMRGEIRLELENTIRLPSLQALQPTDTPNMDLQVDSAEATPFRFSLMQTDNVHAENENLPPLPDDTTQKLYENLQTILVQYTGSDPTLRPKLPKLRYSIHLTQLIQMFNQKILIQFISDESQLIDIHTLVYCSALVISQELGYKIEESDQPRRTRNRKSPWFIRLERDITQLRSDIGRLTQYINNNRSRRVVDRVEEIFRNFSIHSSHENNNNRPEEFLDTLKQKLKLKAHRLKRYTKALKRKKDNNLFSTNEKIFYRQLSNTTNSGIGNEHEIPEVRELEQFWAGIWETEVQHNEDASWIHEEVRKCEAVEEMKFEEITESDIEAVTSRLHNWKSPGIDRIHNFWYKKFHVLHKAIAKSITGIIQGQQNTPEFIAQGVTYMLPKGKYTTQPSQYRPITCLPTIYKILTSAITRKITTHAEKNFIIAEEQKGCRRNHMGCKEQLIIDSLIHKYAASNKQNLHCTYIDYKKAFDSIPHSWLIRILQIYKIDPVLINFLQKTMKLWKTTLHLNQTKTREIYIKKGIYQGDSLSPLWFCLALNPISHMLRRNQAGYRLKHDNEETCISHLIYMDDIKLYSKTETEMNTLIDTTVEFSRDINMQFGFDKCRTIHIVKGKVRPGDYAVDDTESITAMESDELYKYLGYQQSKGINHIQIKKALTAEYKKRVNSICKSQLTSKHLIKAINSYAIPVLTYSFGVIKWTKTDIRHVEIATRTIFTKNNNHHPKSAVERMSIKRENGGRGLIAIHPLWIKQVNNLKSFFFHKANSSDIHKAIVCNDVNFTPLNLTDQTLLTTETDSEAVRVEQWKKKVLHGRHPHDLSQAHVDPIASNKWLKLGSLFPETEGFIIAIQDQVINTKNYRKHIIKDLADDRCRKCRSHPETIQHITGACPNLAQTDYTHRHNQVANIIHQNLAVKHSLIPYNSVPYYKYSPSSVLENNTHKLYFDRAILTDRTIHFNRPDITLTDKVNKITYLIDIAVPNTHNLQKTIAEKIHKYTDLKDEVTRIWHQEKVYIVPIILSTTGVIPKHLHHSLKLIDLKRNTYIQMQKAAILNTCRTVRKFLQVDDDRTDLN